MISIYMGRNKHAKYLRHLNAYDDFEDGWAPALEPPQGPRPTVGS